MLKNYLKITYRKLVRKKIFAAINIIGLAVSLAAALLIFLYVQHELSYDKFNEKADRIYRVTQVGSGGENDVSSPRPLAPTMKQNFLVFGKRSGSSIYRDNHLYCVPN